MLNRRAFIKKASIASALALTPTLPTWAQQRSKKITILHTNDQHSRIEPFERSENPKYSNKGGFARRATLIEQIRKQEKNVLLLDAGDIFQGTPYFNFFGGELEFKLMSKMGYDAATMGNHDFDNGLEGFEKQLKHADFTFICSNYNFKNTLLDGKTVPYKIFVKEGIRIGVFAVGIELQGLVDKSNYKETLYLNPIEIAQQMTRELKAKHCDLIICLSHLGYQYKNDKISDIKLAQATKDIDLIIGGHTHTFLEQPTTLPNAEGKPVIINQVGWAGLYLGRLDFYMDPTDTRKKIATSRIEINAAIA